jgi:hypothetical protein
MTKHVLFGLTIAIVAACTISVAAQNVNLGVSISDGQLKSFYVAVGDYFKMPQRAVTVIREKHVPDDELPVVLFICRRSGVRPAQVIELRQTGKSWLDISLHFGLTPEVYYVPLTVDPGPPYGHAYGYYRKHPRSEWKDIRLEDDDIVNLVNLRFISDHYRMAPEEVVRLRSGQRNFVLVNDQAYKAKHQYAGDDEDKPKGDHGKGHKGKGHGKKQGSDD